MNLRSDTTNPLLDTISEQAAINQKEQGWVEELRNLRDNLHNEIAILVEKKMPNGLYVAGQNKELDKKTAKYNFLNAVMGNYFVGARVISPNNNNYITTNGDDVNNNTNYNNNTQTQIHLASNKSLMECVKESAATLSPETRELIIGGAKSRVYNLMVKVLGDSKAVKKLFKETKAEKTAPKKQEDNIVSYDSSNNNNNNHNHTNNHNIDTLSSGIDNESKSSAATPEKDQKLKKEIEDLIEELNTETTALDQDITKAPKLSKKATDLTRKKDIKIAKKYFLKSIIDDQNIYGMSQGKSLGQSVYDKFNDIIEDQDRAELFSGFHSRVEKLIKSILADHKVFLKKQQDLINEMQTLENKLIKEKGDKDKDLNKETNGEKFSKLQIEANKKEKKSQFLANVQLDYGMKGNKDKAVKDSVEKVLQSMNYKDRELIIGGTFSRVNDLMEKVLGDSKTVKTLFKAPKPGKTDLTNLEGDSLYRAKIYNLTIDLDNEISSFFPTRNKERKILKFNFLETLLNEYDERKNDSTVTLKALYETAFNKLTPVDQEKLLAGSNSRVKGVLRHLSGEGVSNNASNNLNNTNNTL